MNRKKRKNLMKRYRLSQLNILSMTTKITRSKLDEPGLNMQLSNKLKIKCLNSGNKMSRST
jgi:hypothetical protein